MTRYALFLRGINVGGVRVAMPELRATLAGIGCTTISTWLNTGNVALDDARDADHLKTAAEKALTDTFGYNARVIVRPLGTLANIVQSWPFGQHDDCHRYVVFGGAIAYEDAAQAATGEGLEAVACLKEDLMWRCPKGASTTSPVAKVLGQKHLKQLVTTRNLNTVEKMLTD